MSEFQKYTEERGLKWNKAFWEEWEKSDEKNQRFDKSKFDSLFTQFLDVLTLHLLVNKGNNDYYRLIFEIKLKAFFLLI